MNIVAGSVVQDHNDYDVALVKYRTAAQRIPNCAQVWNNIGMAFFGKNNLVAAIACLKRASYIDPFDWMISFNLGQTSLNFFHHQTFVFVFRALLPFK